MWNGEGADGNIADLEGLAGAEVFNGWEPGWVFSAGRGNFLFGLARRLAYGRRHLRAEFRTHFLGGLGFRIFGAAFDCGIDLGLA